MLDFRPISRYDIFVFVHQRPRSMVETVGRFHKGDYCTEVMPLKSDCVSVVEYVKCVQANMVNSYVIHLIELHFVFQAKHPNVKLAF